jgi:DNA-binding NarL/FixJ family response regulator
MKSKLRLKGIRNIPRGPRASTRSNSAHLTSRQIDVLFLLKEGLANTEIANRLFISAKTTDHHISAILSKLNVHSRGMAIREAEKLGIL